MSGVILTFTTTIDNSGHTPTATSLVRVTLAPAELSAIAQKPGTGGGDGWGSEPPQIVSWLAHQSNLPFPHAGSGTDASSSSSISGGAIAGIVIGAIAALAFLLTLVFCLLHVRRSYPVTERGRDRSRGGSSERGLASSAYWSADEEGAKGKEMDQQSQQLPQGKMDRLCALLIPGYRSRKAARAAASSQKPIKAELGDTHRQMTEISSHDPRTSIAELQSPQRDVAGNYGPTPETALTTQASTLDSSAELEATTGGYHTGLRNEHTPMQNGKAQLPAEGSVVHPVSQPTHPKYELDATQPEQYRLPPKSPQQFPYQGLLEKHVDKRTHTPEAQ